MKKLLLILAMLVLVIGLIGCGKEEAAPEAPSAPAVEEAPAEAPVEEAEMEETESPEVEEEIEEAKEIMMEGEGDVTDEKLDEGVEYNLPVDASEETEYFDEIGCSEIDGKLTISVKVTNSGTEDWIVYGMENPKGNLRLTNRGITDTTAGCEVQELAPGESTMCSGLDMGAISGENRVSIQSTEGTEVKIVICP